MSPALSAVGRLVDPVAGGKIGTPQSFPAAHIDDVGIGGRESQRADRSCRLAIEDWIPGTPEIVSLPNASVVGRHEEDIGLIGNTRDCDGASGTERSNAAPAQLLVGNISYRLGDCA